jgi:hypothetical protein
VPCESGVKGGAMTPVDDLVYAAPDRRSYVANFEPQGWVIWPAEQDGWRERRGCPATLVDACEELEPRLAQLALRLSGVPTNA